MVPSTVAASPGEFLCHARRRRVSRCNPANLSSARARIVPPPPLNPHCSPACPLTQCSSWLPCCLLETLVFTAEWSRGDIQTVRRDREPLGHLLMTLVVPYTAGFAFATAVVFSNSCGVSKKRLGHKCWFGPFKLGSIIVLCAFIVVKHTEAVLCWCAIHVYMYHRR